MAEAEKACVICGGEEKDGELLVAAPCRRHWVCPDDVSSFFQRATSNESLFPPKCCGQMFILEDYEELVPFDISWAYQVKEQGEYSILIKFRVYCGNPVCARFLHPSSHVTNQTTNVTYAVCENDTCGKLTCVTCKNLLNDSTTNHVCKPDENEEKFQKLAEKKGYQSCSQCGATVELAEACNHITCSCGHSFCYLCGKEWAGLHGCPHYGQATYDEDGYNQDGYHRDTGLNREGLTRRQELARRRGQDADADAEDEEDEGEEDGEEWDVLQHLNPDQRLAINVLHGEAREDALDNLRIQLFETQGITFNQDLPPPVHITIHQADTVDVIMRPIHDAAGDQIGPLLDQLHAGGLGAQTAPAIFGQISDLVAQHITQEHARLLLDLIVVLNADQLFDLARQLDVHVNRQHAQDFVEHLSQHLLDMHPGAVQEDESNDEDADNDDEDGNEEQIKTDLDEAHDAEDAMAVEDETHGQDAQPTLPPPPPPQQQQQSASPPTVAAPEISLENEARSFWGPPGGWPRDDEEL
ncbi:hypothetical protein ACEQ8H_007272 [Pleosporales sp. CAS-2024a]